MKTLLATLLLAVGLQAAPVHLGSFTFNTHISWSDSNPMEPMAGYNFYIVEPNTLTPVHRQFTPTNGIAGPLSNTNISGLKWIYATAVNAEGAESVPSDLYAVTFKQGVPLPPTNFMLFSAMRAMGSEALPEAQPVRAPPMPSVMPTYSETRAQYEGMRREVQVLESEVKRLQIETKMIESQNMKLREEK